MKQLQRAVPAMKISWAIVLFAAALQGQFQGKFHDVAAQAGLRDKLTSGSAEKPWPR